MSKAPYTLHKQAERELEQAALYYDAEYPGRGRRFVDAFEKAMLMLCAHPEAAPAVHPPIRAKTLRIWPYKIYYRNVRGRPRVLAVAHTKRQPFYWLGRH